VSDGLLHKCGMLLCVLLYGCCVFLELISDHKQCLALVETSTGSEVLASCVLKLPAVGDDLSSLVKSAVSTNESHSIHRTTARTQTSVSPPPNFCAQYDHEDDQKKIVETAERITTSLPDDEARKFRKGDSDNVICSSTYRPCASDVSSKTISQSEMSTDSFRQLDVSSALAADMLSLYRNKVLAKNSYDVTFSSSGCPCPPLAVPATGANSRVKRRVLPYSGVMQCERKVATGTKKLALVSKSRFKLVKAKTESSTCHDDMLLPHFLKSWQAEAHFDSVGCNIPRNIAQSSTSTSSFCHLDSRPGSSLVNTARAVSCVSAAAKNFTQQITAAVSRTANAVTKPSSCAIVSSFANSVPEKNCVPKVDFTSTKYKLVRKREPVCRNTPSRTSVIPLNDTNIPALVPYRDRRTPISGRITVSVSSNANDVTKPSRYATASSNFASFLHKRSANLKKDFTSSKYKLVRRRESACRSALKQTSFVALNDTSVSNLGSRHVAKYSPTLHVVNKYKLVRKRRLSTRRPSSGVKKMASSMNSSPGILSPIGKNSLASDSKTRSSRYKLVRQNVQARSSQVKKPTTQLASDWADDKAHVLSRYKLVRRKSNASGTTSQMPQHAAVDSQHFAYAHSLYHKHSTPPLFLNKYKLIRKRAMLKTRFALQSLHYLTRSRKPSAEKYKRSLYSRRHCSSAEMALLNKQRRKPRRQSFMSKYALQRSGKGKWCFLFLYSFCLVHSF